MWMGSFWGLCGYQLFIEPWLCSWRHQGRKETGSLPWGLPREERTVYGAKKWPSWKDSDMSYRKDRKPKPKLEVNPKISQGSVCRGEARLEHVWNPKSHPEAIPGGCRSPAEGPALGPLLIPPFSRAGMSGAGMGACCIPTLSTGNHWTRGSSEWSSSN